MFTDCWLTNPEYVTLPPFAAISTTYELIVRAPSAVSQLDSDPLRLCAVSTQTLTVVGVAFAFITSPLSGIPFPLESRYMYCAWATCAKPAIATTATSIVRSRFSMMSNLRWTARRNRWTRGHGLRSEAESSFRARHIRDAAAAGTRLSPHWGAAALLHGIS